MREQVWFCLDCERCGKVEYEDSANIDDIVYAIRNFHHRVSPDCQEDPRVLLYRATLEG